jgi:glycosyltransferase involved in cell wall biosynthesis
MGATQPLATVVIPVYNARPYLRAAVQSVLDQTHKNLEIIIIDDGSTDGSMEAIADFGDARIQRVRQDNAGKPAAMNRALAMMKGEYYAINDADDLSHPRRIERQIACMQEYPALAAVFCGHELILNEERMAPQSRGKDEGECREDIAAFRMPGHDPTALYRVGLTAEFTYDPTLWVAEGLDYILRIGERHPMRMLGECLYSYRIHQQSITKRSPEKSEKAVADVLRRTCERRGLAFEELFASQFGRTEARRFRNQDLDNNLAAHFIESVLDLRGEGRVLEAVRTGVRCAKFHPLDPHYCKALAYSLMPLGLVRRVRAKRTNGKNGHGKMDGRRVG